MLHTKKTAPDAPQLTYEAEMSGLREKLSGRPYVKGVQDLLPELSKDHIRNVVNGKCSNLLVLAALKIVVHKLESDVEKAKSKLSELTQKLENLGVAA